MARSLFNADGKSGDRHQRTRRTPCLYCAFRASNYSALCLLRLQSR
ncbi:Uncharacterised protein [Vibrio cholerae]|nr:Uncharacterised protein [Vibrio cholerae]